MLLLINTKISSLTVLKWEMALPIEINLITTELMDFFDQYGSFKEESINWCIII